MHGEYPNDKINNTYVITKSYLIFHHKIIIWVSGNIKKTFYVWRDCLDLHSINNNISDAL